MSIQRWAKRVDETQVEVRRAAENLGAAVVVISQPVDLLVEIEGINFLWEVKSRGGKLTDSQADFVRIWRGPIVVISSAEEARQEVARVRRLVRMHGVSPLAGLL